MKVYEVYHSDYDEHRIYFICSSRLNAEWAVKLFHEEHGQLLSIHEWEVDDLSAYIGSKRAKP